MLEVHVFARLGNLCVAVVFQVFACERQRVALYHLYVAERLERVCFFVEICAVAIQLDVPVQEFHVAVQDVGVRIVEHLVSERVGVDEVYFLAFRARLVFLYGCGCFRYGY